MVHRGRDANSGWTSAADGAYANPLEIDTRTHNMANEVTQQTMNGLQSGAGQ